MRLLARSSLLLLLPMLASGVGFFSNPHRLASLSSPPWETTDIGVVWSDAFNRSTLGSDWILLGGASVTMSNNSLLLSETSNNPAHQIYYALWQICSDAWTMRWNESFLALSTNGLGLGVGLKNFQSQGGDDRGYNAWFIGSGTNSGRMAMARFDGTTESILSTGATIPFNVGEVIDCSLTRSAWTMTATASNRVNHQVSSASMDYNLSNPLAPTISRACIYSLGGTVALDDFSFTLNHRKPARFICIGASGTEGYNATSVSKRFISVIQSNFTQVVCNDSGSYNTSSNSVAVLPEILAHRPEVAILAVGPNDLQLGYPASQWQTNYSNLVAQLQLNGVKVKHCLPWPRNVVDLRPLKDWIKANYPSPDIIDIWTPLLSGASGLSSTYDSGDGVHPNDAGHLLIGSIIRTNLF